MRTIQTNLASWEALNLLPACVDLLNINLALHYFLESFAYIVKSTNPTYVNLLILDGSKLLKEQSLTENKTVKYYYSVSKTDPSRIKVKLPFRDELTEETIVYPRDLID